MDSMTGARPDAVTNGSRDGELSEEVILAVAEAKGVDPLELDPLYTVVDPDALNRMFRPSVDSPPADLELRFSMAGCRVVVHGDGQVDVTPTAATDARATPVASHED